MALGLLILALETCIFAGEPLPQPADHGPTQNPQAVALKVLPPPALAGPNMQVDALVFDFGRVMSGELVKHTFYLTNLGGQDLILSNVQAACGCSAAGDWQRLTKPGESGQIPVQFNTFNYNAPVSKVFTVTSNDQTKPPVVLQLKGVVWKPIDVIPSIAALTLRPDFPFGSVTVQITNCLEEPLLVSPPESNNQAFGAEFRTNHLGRDYIVIISNSAAFPPGVVQGQITLKTSFTSMPVINIFTWANVQPVMNIVPARIDLGQAPLQTNQLAYVNIINNTTNPVILSEFSAGAGDVDIKITENQAGRNFTAVLNFPPGFELPTGQPGAFTVKTTHAGYPLIKVPIYQRSPAISNVHAGQ